ncbi:hypothetical protein NDU88_005524 [Pleurodeles waltl]|uniref:Uncharacterized protein n=1 Tax=Pleurodeles waltl TaxID=8319 RepID=A0AAV7RNI7_PLEWA|nr:hypothetical protein NDU88_005524 [Pleurodeles waltl]
MKQRHGLVRRWELPCGGGTICAHHFYRVSVTPPPKVHKRGHPHTQHPSTSRQPPVPAPAPKTPKVTPPTTTSSSSTPRHPPATNPSVRQKLSLSDVDLFAPTPTPPIHKPRSSASAKKTPVPVVRVQGVWSAPATMAGSVTRSQSTASPPPVKHLKLESGRRDRVKSAVTPPKVVKCQKKSAQSGKSSTVEEGAILPGGRDATASTVVTGQETTAGVSAQEGRSIVTGQETTAGVSAQEGRSIVTGQETTTGVSAQEGPGSHSPAGQ